MLRRRAIGLFKLILDIKTFQPPFSNTHILVKDSPYLSRNPCPTLQVRPLVAIGAKGQFGIDDSYSNVPLHFYNNTIIGNGVLGGKEPLVAIAEALQAFLPL